MSHDHLIPLRRGEFSVWRSFCLRTAGMPFDWVSSADAARQPLARVATGSTICAGSASPRKPSWPTWICSRSSNLGSGASFEFFETWDYQPGPRLNLPITVIGARDDVSVAFDELLMWHDNTGRSSLCG